jgi:hypothetical protein
MSEVRTGIVITGNAKGAQEAFKSVAQESHRADEVVKRFDRSGGSLFKTIVGMNQGLALARKAFSGIASVGRELLSGTAGFDRMSAGAEKASRSLQIAADRSGVFRQASKEIKSLFDALGAYFGSDQGRKDVNDFFAAIANGSADALDAFVGLIKASTDFSIAVRREWARIKGENFAEPLEEDVEQRYGRIVVLSEDLANRLRISARKEVESKREFYHEDEKAARKAAQEKEIAFEAAAQAAIDRAYKQAAEETKAIAEATAQEIAMKQAVGEWVEGNAARRAEVEEKFIDARNSKADAAIQAEMERTSELTNITQREEALRTLAKEIESEKRVAIEERDFGRIATLEAQLTAVAESTAQTTNAQISESVSFLRSVAGDVYYGMKQMVSDLIEGSKSGLQILADLASRIANTILDKLAGGFMDALFGGLASSAGGGHLGGLFGGGGGVLAGLGGALGVGALAAIPLIGAIAAAPSAVRDVDHGPRGTLVGGGANVRRSTGGLIPHMPGSRTGVDSVHTLLAPGELVVPVPLVEQLVSVLGAGRAHQEPAPPQHAAADAPVTVIVQTLDRPQASWERTIEGPVAGAIQRARRRGTLKLTPQRWTRRKS